ncbi:MAG: folylpolyglutamate synthase/dihydrofolate synthase family protein [Pirellulales bacterium]
MPTDPSADYKQAIDYLLGRINYERNIAVPYAERAYKLGRMRELLRRLEDPQNCFPIVHIAGTKGKGSTAEMLSRVLQAAGLRVGVYSSPHLERLEERFAVDSRPCSAEELVALVRQLQPVVELMDRETSQPQIDELGPTYFELTTAMALAHFQRRAVDVAILEVGMGGRLDSTNVCMPICSVITSISFDHTKQLGDTLAKIAAEKAGIIKPGVPVISGVDQAEPRATIADKAHQVGAPLKQVGVDFDGGYADGAVDFRQCFMGEWQSVDRVRLGMPGAHQACNAAVALATATFLQAYWPIPEEAMRRGLQAARLPARIEIIRRDPTIVLDAAHNPASMAALLAVLQAEFPDKRGTLLFAASRDKDYRRMLELALPHFSRVVFTRYLENPRAVAPEELRQLAAGIADGDYRTVETPRQAWSEVQSALREDDLVCVTGSFFIAAELRGALLRSAEPVAG